MKETLNFSFNQRIFVPGNLWSLLSLLFYSSVLYLGFIDLRSRVRVPTCCTVPACRVWPVPCHSGWHPTYGWQHHSQWWVYFKTWPKRTDRLCKYRSGAFCCVHDFLAKITLAQHFLRCPFQLRLPHVCVWCDKRLPAGEPAGCEDQWMFSGGHSYSSSPAAEHFATTVWISEHPQLYSYWPFPELNVWRTYIYRTNSLVLLAI